LPVSEAMAQQVLSLPVHPLVGEEGLKTIAEALANA